MPSRTASLVAEQRRSWRGNERLPAVGRRTA
jgi:hypothetical protein